MPCRASSKPAQELLHFGVIASFHKQKAIGAVLKNQSDVPSHAEFKKASRQLADAQTLLMIWMAEILLQAPQRQSNFADGSLWDKRARARGTPRLNPEVSISQVLFQIAGKAFDFTALPLR